MKLARWLLVAAAAFVQAPSAMSAGGNAMACCGQLGNAGPWGGGSHFSLCIAGATCGGGNHTQVGVTYFSGDRTCPSGYYDCAVKVGPLACGYSCQGDSDCGGYSPSPSCCSGYKTGTGCSNTEFRGCCGPNEIRVPSSIQSSSSEWIVSYGNKFK